MSHGAYTIAGVGGLWYHASPIFTLSRHQNIVQLYDVVDISGHTTLFMAVAGVETKAGTYTLAQRLRYEGRPSLDLLQRFGEELLTVADWLEQKGM